jgi:hypothetical protein
MRAEPKTNARGKALRVDRSCISNPPKFNPTDAQWADFEKGYRRSLDEADRLQIQKIVNEYLRDETLFVATPFKKDVQNYLSEIRGLVRKNLAVLNKRGPAEIYVWDLICQPEIDEAAGKEAIFRVGPSKGHEAK